MSNEQPLEKFYDVGEVANAIGTGRAWVLDRIRDRDLPAIKLAGSAGYRVSESDLRLFMSKLRERQQPKYK